MPAETTTVPTVTVTLPGSFCDWLNGTGLAQGQDDSDPECKALRLAYKAAPARRNGRSYYVKLTTGDDTTLRVLAEYAGYCADSNVDEPNAAEVRAAHTVEARAIAARKELRAAQAEADGAGAPAATVREQQRAALDRIKAKADADRAAYRATTDDQIAAECATHGVPAPRGVVERIAARTATREAPAFSAGDRIVCADGVTRVVVDMAPIVSGEPAHVIVEGGAQWIAENCLRANPADVDDAWQRANTAASRVCQDPDPTNPEWRVALEELGAANAYLKAADPIARDAALEADAREAGVVPTALGLPAEPTPAPTRRALEGVIVTHDGTAEGSAPKDVASLL